MSTEFGLFDENRCHLVWRVCRSSSCPRPQTCTWPRRRRRPSGSPEHTCFLPVSSRTCRRSAAPESLSASGNSSGVSTPRARTLPRPSRTPERHSAVWGSSVEVLKDNVKKSFYCVLPADSFGFYTIRSLNTGKKSKLQTKIQVKTRFVDSPEDLLSVQLQVNQHVDIWPR